MALSPSELSSAMDHIHTHFYHPSGKLYGFKKLTPHDVVAMSYDSSAKKAHLDMSDAKNVLEGMRSSGRLSQNYGKVKSISMGDGMGGDGEGGDGKLERPTVIREITHHIPTHGLMTGYYQGAMAGTALSNPALGIPPNPIGSIERTMISAEYATRGGPRSFASYKMADGDGKKYPSLEKLSAAKNLAFGGKKR